MVIVDTHCHLDFDRFDDDRDEVIQRARDQGVVGMILIGIDPESWATTRNLADGRPGIWRTAGLHPNSVERPWNENMEAELRKQVASGELVAIGETGVDLYRSSDTLSLQTEAFEAQIEIAKEAGLPIVIHQRAAEEQVLDVLGRHSPVDGVMHCFGGDWAFARKCLDLGLHLGIGGVATFKGSNDTREAVSRAPEDRLLLETDAPFLAPQAVRGQRNEPAFLRHVVDTIADCRKVPAETVEEFTTRSAIGLFGLCL